MISYRRRIIQVICAMIYNCNFTGFVQGSIYKGSTKSMCVPGLNCYSCPGAVGACPIGSLQSALAGSHFRFPYYVLGLLLLFGVLLGRLICGFLCPFGLIQELLYKLPTKKLPKSPVTRVLSYGKYLVLGVMVILVPILLGCPGFCKYICPAGTLEAGLPLAAGNLQIRSMLGVLFTWKVCALVFVIAGAVFVFRCFCRFLCPLGAFYSLFHKAALTGMEADPAKCDGCGACRRFCRMDIRSVGDRECVQCGACAKICPHQAICRRTLKLHDEPKERIRSDHI